MEFTNPGTGLLHVTMEVEKDYEDELNAWYDEEHVPERLACHGFVSARRFRLEESSDPYQARYLAVYELDNPAVLQTEEYLFLTRPTKRWAALLPHVKVTRSVYADITKSSPADFVLDTDR